MLMATHYKRFTNLIAKFCSESPILCLWTITAKGLQIQLQSFVVKVQSYAYGQSLQKVHKFNWKVLQ